MEALTLRLKIIMLAKFINVFQAQAFSKTVCPVVSPLAAIPSDLSGKTESSQVKRLLVCGRPKAFICSLRPC